VDVIDEGSPSDEASRGTREEWIINGARSRSPRSSDDGELTHQDEEPHAEGVDSLRSPPVALFPEVASSPVDNCLGVFSLVPRSGGCHQATEPRDGLP
jgi:hypothetical protein